MGLLLDTTFVYRLMALEGDLRGDEGGLYSRGREPVFASVVSLWEMRLKYQARHRSGRRKSPYDPEQVMRALYGLDIPILPLTPPEAVAPLAPPLVHRDPFDQLLLVQAGRRGLKLLTCDHLLIGHPFAASL